MKYLYITNGFFDRNEANMVQSFNTVAALCDLPDTSDVCFVAQTSTPLDTPSLESQYHAMTGDQPPAKLRFQPMVESPHSWLQTINILYRTLKQVDYQAYDLVYTRSRDALILLTLLGHRQFVFEAHTLHYPGSLHKRVLYKAAARFGNAVISCINQALLDDFASVYGVKTNRLALIRCGARSEPSTVPPISERQYITYCGSSYPGKGFEAVIHAAKQFPQQRFLAITRSSPNLERLAQALPANLELIVDLDNSKVGDYLKQSCIALAPYEPDATTSGGWSNAKYLSPLKVFEYMAFGCVVVASNLPAIKEIMDHEGSGFLYRAGDLDSFTQALSQALKAVANGEAESVARCAKQAFEQTSSYNARARLICALTPMNRALSAS